MENKNRLWGIFCSFFQGIVLPGWTSLIHLYHSRQTCFFWRHFSSRPRSFFISRGQRGASWCDICPEVGWATHLHLGLWFHIKRVSVPLSHSYKNASQLCRSLPFISFSCTDSRVHEECAAWSKKSNWMSTLVLLQICRIELWLNHYGNASEIPVRSSASFILLTRDLLLHLDVILTLPLGFEQQSYLFLLRQHIIRANLQKHQMRSY